MDILLILIFLLFLLTAHYTARSANHAKQIERHLKTLVDLWTKKP
jgi:hypothetical protein